jgi:hypothetical protein
MTNSFNLNQLSPELEDEKEQPAHLLPEPINGTILIRMLPFSYLDANPGSIILLQDHVDRAAVSSILAIVVKMDKYCFQGERYKYMNGHNEYRVEVGDIICIKQYAGALMPGSRGLYQTIDDANIHLVYPKEHPVYKRYKDELESNK